jgi:S-formylglutathione hydrolase
LIRRARYHGTILIDQGLADKFLPEQLNPDVFEAACKESGQKLGLNRRAGYDHGYFFIATFMEQHLRHHAAQLLL